MCLSYLPMTNLGSTFCCWHPPFLCSISRLPLRTKTFLGPNCIETIMVTYACMISCLTFVNVCKTITEITKIVKQAIPFPCTSSN